jgi:hypothetical protein
MNTKPNYNELAKFYNEDYYKAYNVVDKISVANDLDFIVLPFHKIVTTYYSTAVCADLPNFDANDEASETVQNWIKANKIYPKIQMIAEEVSIFGNCFFELITTVKDDKNEVLLISHSVDNVTIIKDPFYNENDNIQYLVQKPITIGKDDYIINSLHSKTTKEIYITKKDDDKKERVRLTETFLSVLRKYYTWDEATEYSLTEELKSQSFFHFTNTPTMALYGESDYTKQFNNFVYKYAKRLLQIDSILDRHADPRLKISSKTFDLLTANFSKELQKRGITTPTIDQLDNILADNNDIKRIARENDLDIAQLDYILKKTKIYPTSSLDGGNGLEYVTWNAELTSSFTFLDLIFNSILMIIGMNKQMVSNDIALANLSGVAYDKMIRVFKAKVKRKRDSISETLTKIIETAYYLETNEIAIIDTKWHDNIDDQELIKNMYIELYNNHLATKKMAIEKIYDVDEARAEEIERDIENENNTELLTINE